MKCEERPGRGARRQNEGDRSKPKDSTGRNRPVSSTSSGRKSPWVRLSDAILEAGADPTLREVLEAGRHVDAEPGDGAAAFLPGGEALLLLADGDGLLVRRHAPADEVALFLAGVREAA